MSPQSRIRLARRHAGLSQMQLAVAVGVQRGHIHMGDARVTPLSLPRRPAAHFHAIVTQRLGEQEDLFEGEIRQNRADKTELHN